MLATESIDQQPQGSPAAGSSTDEIARAESRTASLTGDSLMGGASLLLLLTVGQRLVGLGRQIITCRYLDPAELGRWNLAFSVLILAAPLIVIGIPGSFGRYVQYYEHRNQLRSFLRRTTLATIAFTILGITIICINADTIAWMILRDSSQAGLVRLLAATLASVVLFNYLIELMTAMRQIRTVAYMQLASGLLFAAATAVLLVSRWHAAEAIIASYAVACLLTSLLAVWPLITVWRHLERSGFCTQRTMWAKLLPFAAWIWLANLLSNLFSAADRYMIVHFSGGDSASAIAIVGQYHSSRVFPELMAAVATLLGSIILPYVSRNWEQGNRQRVSDRINGCQRLFAVGMTIGGILILALAPALFRYGLGNKYAEGLTVLPWSMIGCIWIGQFYIAQNYHLCAERAGRNSVALAIGLIGNIALNALLLPMLGLLGAVFATAAANLLALMIVCLSSARMGLRLELGTIISTLLPFTLALGPVPATIVVIPTIVWGLWTGVLCQQEQLTELMESASTRFPRLSGLVTTAFSPVWTLS